MTFTTPYVTAGAKQYQVAPHFVAYQYKDSFISNKVYWDNSSAYPITTTNMIQQQLSSNKFVGGEILFDFNHSPSQVPSVGQARTYTRLTASAANGAAKIPVAWNMSTNKFGVFVLRSTGAATTGTVKFRSSIGNEITKDFTLSSTAGVVSVVSVDLTDPTTYTGTPVLSNITEVEVQIATSGNSLEVAMVYGVDNFAQIIGTKIVLPYTCVSSINWENTIETAQLACQQLTEKEIATGRTVKFNLTAKKRNLLMLALASGKVPASSTIDIIEVANDSQNGKRTITAGTITITAGQKIAAVIVNGNSLIESMRDSTTNLDPSEYHYNSTTGVLTFNSALNGYIPVVYVNSTTTIENFDVSGLELGYIGKLYITRDTEGGSSKEYIKAYKVQLLQAVSNMADDGDEIEMQHTLLPDPNGKFYNVASSN